MARRQEPETCSVELARRLRWHVYSCLSQGADCSLLTVHPLADSDGAHASGPRPLTLAPLAERLSRGVRASDAVEVDAFRGIGIALYGAGREGARAVFERLCERLHVADGSGVMTQLMAIGLASSAADWRDEAAIIDAITDAWQPRVVVATEVPSSALACDSVPCKLAASPRKRMGTGRGRTTSAGSTRGAAAGTRRPRLRVLAGEHTAHENHVLREQARALGVPFVDLPSRLSVISREAVTPELARELRAVPIGRTRGTLTVAMHDPHDHDALLRLGAATGLVIFPVLAAPDALDRALRQLALG